MSAIFYEYTLPRVEILFFFQNWEKIEDIPVFYITSSLFYAGTPQP